MDLSKLDLAALENLPPEEKAYAMKILQDMAEGNMNSYTELLASDYKEIPVDIETFLTDDNYLGKAWKNISGHLKLYPFWLEQLKKLFPNNFDTAYNTLLESGARGIGKAQPLYSKLLTKDGFITMGDVKIGTQLYGEDGKLHNVIAVFPQGKKPVYEVRFSDNSTTRCSDEHLWTVRKKYSHNRIITLTLNELIKSGLFKYGKNRTLKYAIPICEPIEFEHQDVYIDPYTLGCLIGDGGMTGKHIAFISIDEEIVNNINESISKNGYFLSKYPDGRCAYGLKRLKHKNSPNEYFEEIKKYNLDVVSNKKHIPQEYLITDVNSRIELLQGLMDTDGSCDKNGYCTFTTVSEQLKDDFIFLIQSLGGTAPYRIRKDRKYKDSLGQVKCGQIAYEISVNLPKTICPFKLTRKKERMLDTKHPPVRAIKEITYIGEEECQCILLDSDSHLYLTDNLIVTHNSEVACGCVGAYLMYRVMCLKNPLEFYNLKQTEKICFAFMNIKLDLANEIAVSKFQKTIQMSPWFMSRGTMTQKNNAPYWVPPEPINIIIGSQSDDVIGKPIFYAFFDEISFIKNQDLEKQKKKAKDMIDTAIGGMMTRFVHKSKNPTMLVVASSKRSEQSFMEEYIKTLSANESNKVLVVDKPVWEVKPKGTYSDKIFYVGLGNKFLESIVIPDSDVDNLDMYVKRGYKILEVPEDFKAKFLEDIERNLCDFAGISSSSSNKYMSGQIVEECICEDFKNPLPDIIETGDGPEDMAQYYNFFNLSNVPNELKSRPLYVHLDMSYAHDMTGIAGVWITGKKPTTDGLPAKDLSFRLAFSTSIKAPKGRHISFEKNRNFIRWLKQNGFNIREISADTFQSEDCLQILTAEGFKTSVLSVDRVDTDRICKPYQFLRSAVYEKRFSMYYSKRLLEEFVDVERNNNSGKVDHTPNGHKDALDATCGATFTASKHAEEYAYDYGESLDATTQINNATTLNDYSYRQQINVDFEEELKRAFDPLRGGGLSKGTNMQGQKPSEFMDFGLGSAKPLGNSFAMDNILIW